MPLTEAHKVDLYIDGTHKATALIEARSFTEESLAANLMPALMFLKSGECGQPQCNGYHRFWFHDSREEGE